MSPFDRHRISVAEAWQRAIAAAPDPMNEMSFCAPAVVENYDQDLVEKFDGNVMASSTTALRLKVLEVSEEYVVKYLALALKYGPKALAAGPQNMGFKESDHPRYFNLTAFSTAFYYAMAQSMDSLRVPDAVLLKAWAQRVAENAKKGRSRSRGLDDVEHGRMLQVTLCALLAHDLPLAKKVLAGGNRYLSHPQQHAAIKAMLDGAEEAVVDGKIYVRIAQQEALEAFFQLYNWYRWPDSNGARDAMYPHGTPELYERVFFDGHTVVGNYFLSWLYLQCVSPERKDETDWDTLKYLMRS
jgi:hypothetical protein